MTDRDLQTATIAALSTSIRRKEVSPVEVTRKCLERIEELNPNINCFITVLGQPALIAARKAEAEITKGRYRGPLHGIPFAAKDLFLTKGTQTSCGSRILANFKPQLNAALLDRLNGAGAILLGKLNMHEFALGATCVNPHFGAIRNPWDLDRIPGGSSGGSAAAIASSMAMLTLGTDTGGSIRIPAALCGVSGLKPTYGRLSRYGVYPLAWSLDHPGPMAKTVLDVALAMNVLAGFDARDPSSSRAPVPDYRAALTDDLKGLSIGVPNTYYCESLEKDVAARFQESITCMKQLGAIVRPVAIELLREAAAATAIILFSESAASLEKWYRTRSADLGADVAIRLDAGARLTVTEYLKAQRIRTKVRAVFAGVFQKCDALITPQLPITAPLIGEDRVKINGHTESVPSALTRLTRINNLVGMPTLTVCCGLSSNGLPVGLQVTGKAFDESTILRIGHAYELHAGSPLLTQPPTALSRLTSSRREERHSTQSVSHHG